ncbi:hypothetical protein, partial [Clostridium sp.]|uniref:hypothetical protein n=1 Tax=Clostridium sp. TaxID=1506 RepID=UPI0035A1511A
ENFYIESFGFKELKNFQIKIFDCENRENVHNPFCINWLDIENIKVEDDICKIIFIGWNQFITIQKA